MIAALASIPLLSAFIGWFTVWITFKLAFHPRKKVRIGNLSIRGFLFEKEAKFKEQVVSVIKEEIISVAAKFNSPEMIEKLKPELNEHIDFFLKVKLKQRMPVIGMLIGERTVNQLKEVFMEELETIFPSVMKSYVHHLPGDEYTDQLIREKVHSISILRIEKIFNEQFSADLRKLRLLATFTGFFIGCIQWIIIKSSLP